MTLCGVTEVQTCSKVDIAGYLFTPLQDRREIGNAQTQRTHIGVIRYRIFVAELLVYWRVECWRDDYSFRLNANVRREYVSLQRFL